MPLQDAADVQPRTDPIAAASQGLVQMHLLAFQGQEELAGGLRVAQGPLLDQQFQAAPGDPDLALAQMEGPDQVVGPSPQPVVPHQLEDEDHPQEPAGLGNVSGRQDGLVHGLQEVLVGGVLLDGLLEVGVHGVGRVQREATVGLGDGEVLQEVDEAARCGVREEGEGRLLLGGQAQGHPRQGKQGRRVEGIAATHDGLGLPVVAGPLIQPDPAQVFAHRALVGVGLDGFPDLVLRMLQDHLADQFLPFADLPQQGHRVDLLEQTDQFGLLVDGERAHLAVDRTREEQRIAAGTAELAEVDHLGPDGGTLRRQGRLHQSVHPVEEHGDTVEAPLLAELVDGLLEFVAQAAGGRREVGDSLVEKGAVQGPAHRVVEVVAGPGLGLDHQPAAALGAQAAQGAQQVHIAQLIAQGAELVPREGQGQRPGQQHLQQGLPGARNARHKEDSPLAGRLGGGLQSLDLRRQGVVAGLQQGPQTGIQEGLTGVDPTAGHGPDLDELGQRLGTENGHGTLLDCLQLPTMRL